MRSGSSAEARQTTGRAAACRALHRLARRSGRGLGRKTRLTIYLVQQLSARHDNPDLLRDLGLCYVNLGQLKECIQLLHHRLVLAPEHSHSHVTPSIGQELQLLSLEKNYFPNARNES